MGVDEGKTDGIAPENPVVELAKPVGVTEIIVLIKSY